jgi:hypothetical protein
MSRLTLIYTIYGLTSTKSGVGVRYTGRPAGRTVGSTGEDCTICRRLCINESVVMAFFSLIQIS